jgi:3-phytase
MHAAGWATAVGKIAAALATFVIVFLAAPGTQATGPAWATVETAPFPDVGTFSDHDISDDGAIWLNAAEPSSSLIIGDNKDERYGGLAIYDMAGRVLQYRQDGQIGNVDLREGFTLAGRNIVLVGANNRTNNTIVFYELNPSTRQLSPVTARSISTLTPNYGFCMYKSPFDGKFYAFVSQSDGGAMEQYELFDAGGKVDASKVRSFNVGSQTEGCVADDELSQLYVGEEDVAIWKYDAEPSGGTARTSVGRVGDGHLVADIEGLTITYGTNGAGYLIASSQGSSTFVVYQRRTGNPFVRTFTVAGSGTVDAVTGTDGIDAVAGNFGPGFKHGLLVVHDETNTGGSTSNLKYVPLQHAVPLSGSTATTTSTTPTPTSTIAATNDFGVDRRRAPSLVSAGIRQSRSRAGSTGESLPSLSETVHGL